MRLKKIEIQGFKSFVDKTVLEFSPGITAIVGPNGCGKSNIADAFRWVLGEQSAKSMRGNKMYDIIFAGTANRAAVNIAEVTLTLTDIGNALPIEYEEVSVTRRLHRSGESQYFINRHPVRLKDVQNMFLDSGIGKNAFAVFEQGKIDQVIQYTPLERRYIFEEAAGILRFLMRKREALHKLEQVDLNTSRVKDIHQEVEKQIIVLEQQAAQARVYKENKASLEVLEKAISVSRNDQLQRRYGEIQKKEEAQHQELNTAKQEFESLLKQLQDAKLQLAQSEKAFRTKSEDLYRTRNEKELKTRERNSQQERLKESLVKEKRWQQELEGLVEKRHHRQSERITSKKQVEELERVLVEHTRMLQEQRENVRQMEEALTGLREQQQGSQQERLKRLQMENQLESEIKQNTIRQDSLNERKIALTDRKSKLVVRVEELSDSLEDKKQAMEDAAKAVDNQKAKFFLIEQGIQKITVEMQTRRLELNAVQQEISDAKARQKVLLRLREEKEGFSSGSKKLLQESGNAKSPLYNFLRGLYEFMNPHAGAEAALASALRPYGQTLVVETKVQFETVLDYAQKNQLKDFSLICLETLQANENSSKTTPKGIVPILEQMAEHSLARHFLSNVYLAENISSANEWMHKQPGSTIWTNEGFFVDSKHVLFFATQGENNVFMREAELKTLQKKLEALEVSRQHVESLLNGLQGQQDKLQSEKSLLDKNIRRDEMTLVEVNFGLQRIHGELEKTRVEESHLNTELQTVLSTLQSVTSKLAEYVQQHREAKTKGEEIQQLCATLQIDWDKQSSALKNERQILQEKEALYRKVSDDNKRLLHSLHILEVKDVESQEQENHLTEELELTKEFQKQVMQSGSTFDQTLKEVEKLLGEVSQACSELEQETIRRKQSIEGVEEKIGNGRVRIAHVEDELNRVSAQKVQLQGSIQSILEELQERYQLTIEEARSAVLTDLKRLESPEQIERQIRKVRQEIENAGDVNMMSIEEFDKNKERYEFLNNQIGDLEGSKSELVQIISELDGESRKVFKETFEIIRGNFKKNFQILFNGGEADLQFTEAADVLEAGIEIIAKPPGKQMRSIQLLSGGEKCLTAMALLFAIFEVKPAPFCILDEIDAPLDDSNVERFVNVVKQFNDRCQFMMITHNKRTMAIADVLCGVSMEERGVSKLIAIEFSKHQQEQTEPTLHFATASV